MTLASRLMIGIAGVIIWFIGVISILIPPDPPSKLLTSHASGLHLRLSSEARSRFGGGSGSRV